MKIVVIGGTGLIGTKVVKNLSAMGHEVLAASPNTGVNTITGEGLKEALSGADVVVDAANSPSFEDKAVMEFFETSGRNLLAAEAAAGVKHHVALSVVGTDLLQGSGYFRAKLVQEKLIQDAGIPYSIVRATQFFEFVGTIVQAGTTGNTVLISSALFQPMASDDVAAAVADVAAGAPLNATIDIAGPEKVQLSEVVKKYLALKGDDREVIADIHQPYFGFEINDQSLVPHGDARVGKIRYDYWISLPGNLR